MNGASCFFYCISNWVFGGRGGGVVGAGAPAGPGAKIRNGTPSS